MKFVSWNVNGIRACVTKGFVNYFESVSADIFALQETKLQEGQIELPFEGYHQYWNYADKKGYSGTAVFTRQKPLRVWNGMDVDQHDHEGRLITLEFEQFYFVTCYTPNAQRELTRLEYRMTWEDDFRAYLIKLNQSKPVVLCGDLNVAHQEIDLKNPKTNRKNAGFTDEERGKMTMLLEAGFIDTFRYLYPDRTDAYTWWSYMAQARTKNVGWRIDYFVTSDRLKPHIKGADIHPDILGSDHCPVVLELELD